MSAMTDYLEGKLGDHVLNGIEYPATVSGTVYLGLFSGAVSDALTVGGPGEGEIDGNAYARVAVVSGWTHGPGSGVFTNTASIQFPDASGGDWGVVSGVAIFDALTGGNALLAGTVATPKTIEEGDSAQFPAGQITVSWL